MQFGIVHTVLGAKDLPDAFVRAAQVGAEGLEVFYYDRDAAKWLDDETHPAWMKQQMAESGIAVPSLCLGVLSNHAPLLGEPEQVEEGKRLILRAIDVAQEIGARVILLPFFGDNSIELESELAQAGDVLLDLVEPAEEAGVVLGVESMLNFTQQQFLLDHLGQTPAVGMYVDTANSLARKLDVPTGIRDLGAKGIAQVHLKEVKLAEGQPADMSLALGEGDVDFRAVAQALAAVGYDSWLICEAPGKDDPIAEAKKNLAFARDIFPAE